MRRLARALVVLAVAGCGSSSSSQTPDDAAVLDARTPDGALDGAAHDGAAHDDAALDGGATSDAAMTLDAALDARVADGGLPPGATYRNSLSVCWTDATCQRVMAVGHGGVWDATSAPYDSNAALAAAYAAGMDGVKIDVRVTSDNVPVISHSSPLEIYESVDCYGKRIEQMTAAQVTACHRFPSTTETFQRLDDVLGYLRGKLVVQLTVKQSVDYARTIAAVLALHAEDFAFFEISTSDLQNVIPGITGSGSVYYVIDIGANLSEVDTLLAIGNPRAFLYEMDPSPQIATLTATRLHPAGVRSFTYTSAAAPTVADLKALFDQGFDVVSSQAGANGVQARMMVNQGRGISPP